MGVESESEAVNFLLDVWNPFMDECWKMEHRFDARPRPWLDLIGNDSKSSKFSATLLFHWVILYRSVSSIRCCSHRLSCNKQGGRSVKARDQVLSVRRPRPTTRECCKAMMLVKLDKSGKWVVTRAVKDHAHPLGVSSGNSMASSSNLNSRKKQPLLESWCDSWLMELKFMPVTLLIELLKHEEKHDWFNFAYWLCCWN